MENEKQAVVIVNGEHLTAAVGENLGGFLSARGYGTYPCGGHGKCGKCRVAAEGLLSAPTEKEIRVLGEVTLGWPTVIEIVMILAAAFLSFRTTPEKIRRTNHFTWGPILEVAELFIGIFITMQPALMLLKELGPKLGLSKPWEMFWVTGMLSSVLDNTPTYLVFLTTAGTLGLSGGILTSLGDIPVQLLEAISCGAVFMGAVTYIGNAPNFMVKSISDENGIRMPSFFGYILWSLACLVPVFLADTLVFFL